jgi:4-hydroxy-3-methylbut-2-en-1-yl diphosphate synthase IspG/GcpE
MTAMFADAVYEALEAHQHKNNKLVRTALRQVARNLKLTYEHVTASFKNGDEPVTVEFWKLINAEYGTRFNRVDYCHGCKKFNLYHSESEE